MTDETIINNSWGLLKESVSKYSSVRWTFFESHKKAAGKSINGAIEWAVALEPLMVLRTDGHFTATSELAYPLAAAEVMRALDAASAAFLAALPAPVAP